MFDFQLDGKAMIFSSNKILKSYRARPTRFLGRYQYFYCRYPIIFFITETTVKRHYNNAYYTYKKIRTAQKLTTEEIHENVYIFAN